MKHLQTLILGLVLLALAVPAFAVDIVIQTGNLTSCNARLKQLGIVVRDAVDEEGNQRKIEQRYEIVNTPMLTDTSGDTYFTIRLTEEQAELIPPADNTPNFDVVWDSRENCGTEEEPLSCDWPLVEVTAYDIDGNPSGTRSQGVGRIR